MACIVLKHPHVLHAFPAVYQAWLADDGNSSLLVVNAHPRHLLNSTIFSRLLGLRDTNIGDGVTDDHQVTAEPTEVPTPPADAPATGGDDQGGVHVVEMSHKEAVYPAAAADSPGPEAVRQQQPRQTSDRLPMLTLW